MLAKNELCPHKEIMVDEPEEGKGEGVYKW